MCGIAGVFHHNGKRASASVVQDMIDVMAYRGPDGQGIHIDRHVGLGHRRLAIIDLSSAGHQPMTNEDGTIWLVFNGEIYNYLELINQLQERGHRFRSRSDSEVILHAYEEWGERCVERFNGMWAFAVWDAKAGTLFLSRDRFGVKPLYYYSDHGNFYFGSEIKAILAVAREAARPNYPYLYHFLPSGTLDDGEDTFFEGVKQVLPAHSLIIDSTGSRMVNHWRYDPDAAKRTYDYAHPGETLRALLLDSVKLRLRSDVPVGTCLSGGLDSSSIVALAHQIMPQPVKTFSCLYEDSDCNERRFVDILNHFADTDPYPVSPGGHDLFDILPKIVSHQDEPTAGPGLYSQWHVMATAHGKVKVLLDGQGGDELLGGYFTYFDAYLSSLLKDFSKTKKPIYLSSFLQSIREIRRLTGKPYFLRHLERHLPAVLKTLVRRTMDHSRAIVPQSMRVAPRVLHPDFVAAVQGHEIKRDYPAVLDNDLNNALYWHLVRQSIPALLHYEDRNSMAFSIEARTPFLDYRLVEFCLGLPYDMKIRHGTTKYILRKALERDLPPEISQRKDKMGYPTPMARWFRTIQKTNVEELLFSDEVRRRKILNPDGVKLQIDRHNRGEVDASWEIYRWITMELWFRRFID
jgi:asparagine synthase (glutamine-hydrolysing)